MIHQANIEISNICNVQCSFCPPVEREKGLMSVELFSEVLKKVKKHVNQITLHLMGEPLAHPKFLEILEVANREQMPVFLVTNGILLKPTLIEALLHPTIRQINFSLHSFHDNFGEKDPTPYLEKIFLLSDKALALRPELYLNFRLWTLDKNFKASMLNRKMIERVWQHFRPGEDFIEPSMPQDRGAQSVKLQGRAFLHFEQEFVWPSLRNSFVGLTGTCKALQHNFGVLVDGTVVPCCLDKEGVIPLGNLKSQNMEEVLHADRTRKLLGGFHRGVLVEKLCQHCEYRDRFDGV